MKNDDVIRWMSALVAMITVSVMGSPRQTQAAEDAAPASAGHRRLTLNGLPLSRVLGAPAMVGGPSWLGGAFDQSPGQAARADGRRMDAKRLLGGSSVTETFDALQTVLKQGHEVVVTDTAGRARRGRVASISRHQLVMESPVVAGTWEAWMPLYWPLDLGLILKRRFSRSEARAFTEGSVRRIDIVDSTRNGTATGVAVGVGIAAGVFLWERRQPSSNLKGVATGLALVWGLPVSARIGHLLDRATNEAIYEQRSGARPVTLTPMLGRDTLGVSAHVRF